MFPLLLMRFWDMLCFSLLCPSYNMGIIFLFKACRTNNAEDLPMLTSQVINPCERGKVKCSKNIFTTYTPDWVLASQEFQHFFFRPSNANRYSTQKYNVLNGDSYYRSLIMSFSLNIHCICKQCILFAHNPGLSLPVAERNSYTLLHLSR